MKSQGGPRAWVHDGICIEHDSLVVLELDMHTHAICATETHSATMRVFIVLNNVINCVHGMTEFL